MPAFYFTRLREVKAVSVAEKKAEQATRSRMARSMVILALSMGDGSHSLSIKKWGKRAKRQTYRKVRLS